MRADRREKRAKQIKVYLMDLLCMSPYHNRYLYDALRGQNVNPILLSISFHCDPGYYRRQGIRNDPGVIDVVARMRINTRVLRQALKCLELFVNLCALCIKFTVSRPDIIHVGWLPLVKYIPVEMWLLRIAKSRGIKLVYEVHNVLPHDSGRRHSKTFKRVYDEMDVLVCHTEETRQILIEEFGQDAARIAVIPLGPMFHDSEYISQSQARETIALPPNAKVALFFGAISPYKGVDILLQAWAKLRMECPDCILLVAGPPEPDTIVSDLRHLAEKLNLGESASLRFGFVPTDMLPAYFQAADVIVLPYRKITASGALVTALPFGKAIVATDLPGFREVVGQKSAVLFPQNDVDALSQAIAGLFKSESERAKMGAAALECFRSAHSWGIVAERTKKLYESLLHESKGTNLAGAPFEELSERAEPNL